MHCAARIDGAPAKAFRLNVRLYQTSITSDYHGTFREL